MAGLWGDESLTDDRWGLSTVRLLPTRIAYPTLLAEGVAHIGTARRNSIAHEPNPTMSVNDTYALREELVALKRQAAQTQEALRLSTARTRVLDEALRKPAGDGTRGPGA